MENFALSLEVSEERAKTPMVFSLSLMDLTRVSLNCNGKRLCHINLADEYLYPVLSENYISVAKELRNCASKTE